MRYILGRASLTVCMLALLLAAIRMAQANSVPSQPALESIRPVGCEMPCWIDIRPGISTMTEAIRLLLADPDIDPTSIHPLCEGCISLAARWKNRRIVFPAVGTDSSDLNILVESRGNRDLVQSIVLSVGIPAGDFVGYFGIPERTTAGVMPDRNLYFILEYPSLGMFYELFALCRRSQNVLNLTGNTYVLQAVNDYAPPYGIRHRETWRGFGSADLGQLAVDAGCG